MTFAGRSPAGTPLPALGGVFASSRRRWAAGAIATAAAAVALAAQVEWGAVRRAGTLAGSDPAVVALAVAAYTAAFALRAVAWRTLLQTPTRIGGLFSNLQTSLFLNHIAPFKAGEVARPWLAVRHGIPAGEAVATTVAARAMDFVCLAALAAVLLPASGAGTSANLASLGGAGVVAFGAIVLLVVRQHRPARGPGIIRRRVAEVHTGLTAIPLRRAALAMPLVFASWALEGAVLLAAADLLDVSVSPGAAAGVTAFTILFQVVHFTPGGLGVYETAMATALVGLGMPADDALTLAVLTHGMKFAYAFTAGAAFAAGEGVALLRGQAGAPARAASRFEVLSARLWNVVNEGKPFTPVFTAGVLVALSLPHATDGGYWRDATPATVALVPLALVFYRFDFPLKLRTALWAYLAVFVVATGTLPIAAATLALTMYFAFTVVLWGTVYYHLRIGTPWSNGFRFVRLVAENPDPTSGNFLEQAPKVLLLVCLFEFGLEHDAGTVAFASVATAFGVGASALLLHQWFFRWVPATPQPTPFRNVAPPGPRRSRRVIIIVIDGCRADRLREARTPNIDRLRANGLDVANMSTVYPARTVTCFSSMLTGAPPAVHGMRSNFVPSLGVKCESVFDVLRAEGMHGKLVGIAHLVDAFGERDVEPVTAVMDNDAIDAALVERAQRVMSEEDPDLLVLQLLSVDQTGHARGSYNAEYLAKIEETDGTIGEFLAWCDAGGFLHDAMVIVTADHGQGIGIGGHGHMSPPEIRIPCVVAGPDVPPAAVDGGPRFITDIAATICASLGVRAPADSAGADLLAAGAGPTVLRPVVFVVPAHNEATRLPTVLQAIAGAGVQGYEVIVVDDGSTDGTAAAARSGGATVVAHDKRRGLGAAVRTGLAAARARSPRAVVYLDADCEYDAREAPALLGPIERGEADYVLGNRFHIRPEGMTARRRFANRCFSAALSACCGRWASDGQTGFRAFSPRALEVAEIIHDYNYAQVLTLDLLRKGMRMAEVPISYRRRPGGSSFISGQYLWRVPAGMFREMWDA